MSKSSNNKDKKTIVDRWNKEKPNDFTVIKIKKSAKQVRKTK